jgi:hypothetical protein
MRYKNYYCENCGEPTSDDNLLCRECYFEEYYDKCKCGNTKRIEFDLCRYCNEIEEYKEKKQKFGSSTCPICGEEFLFSEYLHDVIPNEKTRLIANLITHYRHEHQASWNRSCHYISSKWGEDAYQRAKVKHNNRAKRQILRKCKSWIIENEMSDENFISLTENDENTIKLISKTFAA